MSKKSKSAVSKNSSIIAIANDIHFNVHHEPTWRAFRKWHSDVNPDMTVLLGDYLDFGMLSRYLQHGGQPFNAIEQIEVFVAEANGLSKECDRLVCIEGNHDERWNKVVLGDYAQQLNGALGLTLEDQCRAQGLTEKAEWLVEDTVMTGLQLGPFCLRHGHRQGGRFGGGKHLAANRIMKSLGVSEIFGHHHRVQMFCQTAHGKTAIAVANGHMADDQAYVSDPNWQRGFCILELYGPDNAYGTAHPIVIQDGHFAWNGKVYDGN